MQDTAGEAWTISLVTLHMDVQGLADQNELIYNSSKWTLDVVWKTRRKRWMIGTERERERES